MDGDMGSNSGLVLANKSNGKWQNLDAGNLDGTYKHSVDIARVPMTGGEVVEAMTGEEDVEAGPSRSLPLKIAVKREFGFDNSETH